MRWTRGIVLELNSKLPVLVFVRLGSTWTFTGVAAAAEKCLANEDTMSLVTGGLAADDDDDDDVAVVEGIIDTRAA